LLRRRASFAEYVREKKKYARNKERKCTRETRLELI